MKRIILVVNPDGSTQLETKGFTGASCREASQFLERAVGRTTSEQLTAEFHQTAETEQQQPESQ